jgi:hypothetical protein
MLRSFCSSVVVEEAFVLSTSSFFHFHKGHYQSSTINSAKVRDKIVPFSQQYTGYAWGAGHTIRQLCFVIVIVTAFVQNALS